MVVPLVHEPEFKKIIEATERHGFTVPSIMSATWAWLSQGILAREPGIDARFTAKYNLAAS